MRYLVLATPLFWKPEATARALRVISPEKVIGAAYFVDEVVGILPSVV
jgi:hypothetical protein